MELYPILRSDLTRGPAAVRAVAAETGRSKVSLMWDYFTSVVRYGVGPRQYSVGEFYSLPASLRKKTYTRQRRNRLVEAMNDKAYRHLLSNKDEFNEHFGEFVGRGWMHCRNASAGEISAFIRDYGRVIVKPGRSEKGHGIRFLTWDPQATADEAAALAGQDTLLEEVLVQHPNMCFGNRSVNTVRMNTALDRDGEVHLVSAALRCGVGDALVDNYSGGGVVYPLGNEDGRIIAPGRSLVVGKNIEVHPGTELKMPGRVLPCWKEAVALVKAAALVVPQVRLIGWDVAILETGPVLIEGNTRPGETLMECSRRGVYREILSYV